MDYLIAKQTVSSTSVQEETSSHRRFTKCDRNAVSHLKIDGSLKMVTS